MRIRCALSIRWWRRMWCGCEPIRMRAHSPLYELIPTREREWRFQESALMQKATDRFDQIWEQYQGTNQLGRHLKRFLHDYPRHIDGLVHMSNHKLDIGQALEAYGLAYAAVAVATSYFPKSFDNERDRLPGGFVQNRPFLRALNSLRLAQDGLGDTRAAIQTAYQHMSFDVEDRMGVRMILPLYLIQEGRDAAALEIFEKPSFADTFHTAEYLKVLVLIRLERSSEANKTLNRCLHYYPQVARFILDPSIEQPESESRFGGLISGSALEGWFYGRQYAHLWHSSGKAIELLKELSAPFANSQWSRYQGMKD